MENNLSIVKDQFKELPNNIEAEQAVIGSLLVNNEIFDEISTIISGINFYDPMHQKIFDAVDTLIYKGMLANPITLKNYFENESDDLNVPEYLIKITKFSTSSRQAIEYSKIIYDMFVRRELIKISENIIDTAKLNDINVNGKSITVNGDAVANHPVNHTGIKTANGFSKVKVGGTPVNHVGNADTCVTHTRKNGSGNVNINTSG